MPGPAGQLKKLYQQLIGGTAPAGAASSSGDVSQMVKYLIDEMAKAVGATNISPSADTSGSLAERIAWLQANGGATWDKVAPPIDVEAIGVSAPVGWLRMGMAGGLYLAGAGLGVCSAAAGTVVADTSRKATYYRNNNGSNTYVSTPALYSLVPTGRSGAHPALAAHDEGLLIPPATRTVFVMEFEFQWATAVAFATNRGFGLSNSLFSSIPFNAGNHFIALHRNTGPTGWALRTSDGSVSSAAVEASDTSDGNRHIARIEWDTTPEVRLYIDDVLKVTKTTNLPSQVGSAYPCSLGFRSDTGDANDQLRFYGMAAYWRDA